MDIDAENAIQRESAGAADGTTVATDPTVWPSAGPAGARPVESTSEIADALAALRAAGLTVDPTGDERVDEALARLDELGRTAVAEHVEIFDDVRHRLQEVLASVDQDGPRPSAASSP